MTEVEHFLATCPQQSQGLFRSIHEALVKLGCTAYASTIYMGYEQAGTIVAAVYPHRESVEIALALPEDHPSALLKDATHLTWRTMPVAVEVTFPTDFVYVLGLLEEASGRVARGENQVELPIERFMYRERRLSHRHVPNQPDPEVLAGLDASTDPAPTA